MRERKRKECREITDRRNLFLGSYAFILSLVCVKAVMSFLIGNNHLVGKERREMSLPYCYGK